MIPCHANNILKIFMISPHIDEFEGLTLHSFMLEEKQCTLNDPINILVARSWLAQRIQQASTDSSPRLYRVYTKPCNCSKYRDILFIASPISLKLDNNQQCL
ncbi:hypothetical protein Pfo_024518 [Paulownia fortunei]|nr:hypothetical protein Pfo_024518 [Paulownia fortunei]